MFELPEYIILAKQINATFVGKIIQHGQLGNSPHKFVWYNRSAPEFEALTHERTIGEASVKGRWLFIPLEPGYVLVFGECGGKMLYHTAGTAVPAKYHLYLTFEDGSFFTVMTDMWGAMELYTKGAEQERNYIKGMRVTPVEPAFTADYFQSLVHEATGGKKRSVKALLTLDQLIPGLGNSIAQDIMFRARLHPKRPLSELTVPDIHTLYDAIVDTLQEVIAKGGRYDEYDLFNQRGGYIRLMDKNSVGCPCPNCGSSIQKIQYLGGACYLCPRCQQ